MTEIELTKVEDGIIIFDATGKIKFYSDYCDTVLPGVTANLDTNSYIEDVFTSILNLGYSVMAHANDSDLVAEQWAAFKNMPSNLEFISDDGHVLRWSTRRYGEDEVFAVLSDHTWSYRRIFRDAQLSKMSSISEMSGQIGHDLNNFLTIIQGNLELMETLVKDDEKLSRWVSAASIATGRGSDMAKNLLYLGRRRPARRRDVATADAILETIEKIQTQNDFSIQIDILIPSDLHDIRVDETHFKIVMKHLFQNAIEACDGEGKISIRAENFVPDDASFAEQKSDVGEDEKSNVRITVSDTGKGMPVHISQRAFEPYFTTKQDQKSAGLGLSIAYGFARQSGGCLTLASNVGQGTSVVLEIPVATENVSFSPVLTENDDGLWTGTERIMVVEDDTAVRTIAVEMLTSIGYEIVQAPNAANALAQLNAGCIVDLVFSDVIMPGGFDGIHMARIMRDRYPKLKILLASGYVNSERLSGINEFIYLGKPYKQNELAQNVRRLLDNESAPTGSSS